MKKYTFLLTMTAMIVALGVGLIAAAPPRQDGPLIPTPTLPPMNPDAAPYTFAVVGGQDASTTLAPEAGDLISVGPTSVDFDYPNGIIFRTFVESDVADVTSVRLVARIEPAGGSRVDAEYDAATDQWVAHLWEGGGRIPPWLGVWVAWNISDAEGNTYRSEEQFLEYVDERREWYRIDTPDSIVFWNGDIIGMDTETFAQEMALSLAQSRLRRHEVFGGPIDYVPRAIIFGDFDQFSELYGPEGAPLGVNGYTDFSLGVMVQWAGPYPGTRADDYREFIGPACTQYDRVGDYAYLLYDVVPHELGHIFQNVHGVAVGPGWWIEGQASWLQTYIDPADQRMRAYAAIDPDFQSLTLPVSRQLAGADGCPRLVYAVGQSFIHWVYGNYGGTAVALEITRNLQRAQSLVEAIENATGEDFLTLENGWRAYIGFNPLRPEDLDPSLLLEAAPDAVYQDGDSVVLPGPLPVTLKDNPGGVIGLAQCFPNTMVAILRVGSLDGVDWYEVDCLGLRGWLTLDDLQ